MPLPSDQELIAKAEKLLGMFHGAFGPHPGYRPAHAKGQILTGSFKPTAEGKALSKAPIFQSESIPISVRFSNSTGLPQIPDFVGDSRPNGMAVRFELGTVDGRRKHTDIVGHSVPHFPVNDGQGFIDLLAAIGGTKPDSPHPSPIEQFLGANPAALRFVTAPKPPSKSFANLNYFFLNAFKFIAADGKETWVRYQVKSDLGPDSYTDEEAQAKGPNYLFDEIKERVKSAPIGFKWFAQIGEDGDQTDDITIEWPEDRKLVELGSFTLDAVHEDSDNKAKKDIYDPIPRVDGIEPSADPILEFRAALYLLSGRERRAAEKLVA